MIYIYIYIYILKQQALLSVLKAPCIHEFGEMRERILSRLSSAILIPPTLTQTQSGACLNSAHCDDGMCAFARCQHFATK